ncbi:MAG: M28 family peptidase [Clostridia bacterium]|nr:M28 family peptidase [Clostridia bacterium]MBQ8512589.1 M28 family peptidase [Clostridia bacterium]
MDSATYQMDIVRRLSFNRPAGTAECERAAALIADEIRAHGGKVSVEEFRFDYFMIDKASFRVTAPYEKDYAVTGIGYSGNLSGTFPFRYVERATDIDMADTDGAFVLFNHLDPEQYKPVYESGAVGFMTPSGKWYDTDATADLTQSRLGAKLRQIGIKPGFRIRCSDAIEMVRMGAETVQCELKQHTHTFTTQNVISVIEGTDLPGEYITFSAHYDSVPTGLGAFDNATGCAALLDLYRYFMENRPRRTMVFLWCSAEEIGLVGSQDFVKRHPEIMEHAKMEVNFDLTGCVLGYDGVSIAAAQSVCDTMNAFARERRHSFEVRRHAASSDSTAFAEAGVPSFSFYRHGEAELHNRYDLLPPLDGRCMARTVNLVREFVQWCDGAEVFPIDPVIPEDMMKEVRAYLGR